MLSLYCKRVGFIRLLRWKTDKPCAAHLDVNDWRLASSHSAEARSCLTASRCGQPLVWTLVKADGCSNHRLNGWVKAWLRGKTSGILAASARAICIALVCCIYNTLARAAGPACDTEHLCWCVVCVVCMTPSHAQHALLSLVERILIFFLGFFILCQEQGGGTPKFILLGDQFIKDPNLTHI